MADISDVENALVFSIAQAVMPAGYLPPNPAATTAGPVARIYRGWPSPEALNQDIIAGIANISVFPMPTSRNTTRYQRDWLQVSDYAPTLAVTAIGKRVTFSGTADPNQVVGILTGLKPQIFVHRTGQNETPESLAAMFAGAIPGASSSGSVLTLFEPVIEALVQADAAALMETRRTMQMFKISHWCSDPSTRDTLSSLVDGFLSNSRSLLLPDGTATDLPRYAGQFIEDTTDKAGIYRRDLHYNVEYATTLVQSAPRLMFPTLEIGPNDTTQMMSVVLVDGTVRTIA